MGVLPQNKKNNKQDVPIVSNMICNRCNVPLELIEVHMMYLDRHFTHKVPRCSKCGQVYFDEDLVEGRIHDLEFALEEK